MPLLDTTLLSSRQHVSAPSIPVDNGFKTPARSLKPRASLAALSSLIRDPLGAVGDFAQGWADGLTKEERNERIQTQARTQLLYLNLREATTYVQWEAAAKELDQLEGNNAWKKEVESPDYSPTDIRARLDQLEDARISGDIKRMLFLIRTSLTRNLGNMGNVKLYKHSHIGTKDLIERYIDSSLGALDALLQYSERTPANGLEPRKMLEQVLAARQAFGRSALLLSGGANFGMNHSGVLKALFEHKLLPRIISGASAGSIVCSVLCTRTDEEVPDLLETFCHGDLAVFEEDGADVSVMAKATRLLKYGSVFDIKHLTRVMRELLGDMTFQEAYNRTRRILNICVSSASLYELPRLLNYITAPNVLIWSAVAASCSVPFVFSAASILAKDPKSGETVPWNASPQKWIDGSVDNDLPMTRLAEMFNVNHFIVSQVNPHVVPFLVKEEEKLASETLAPPATVSSSTWLHTMTSLAKSEAIYRMHTLIDAGVFPTTLTKTVSVLSQKYSGDITILPEISYTDFPTMMSNPTEEFMERAMLAGERATWPKFSRIRNHVAIELALDDAVQKLRTRVVFESSEADVRLGDYSKLKAKLRTPHATATMSHDGQQRAPRRKPSHSSELDHSVTEALKNKKPQNSKLTKPRGSKTRSLHFFPWSRQDNFSGTAVEVASPLPEILSSGAETSTNLYTSDSYADQSSVSSSASSSPPMSPSARVEAEWEYDSRDTFLPQAYSYSVPVTPATHRRQSSFLGLTPIEHEAVPHVEKKSGAETPKARPSVQETRYKRLFHGKGKAAAAAGSAGGALTANMVDQTQRQTPLSPPSSGGEQSRKKGKRLNALGLEIDLTGTKSVVSRRKGV